MPISVRYCFVLNRKRANRQHGVLGPLQNRCLAQDVAMSQHGHDDGQGRLQVPGRGPGRAATRQPKVSLQSFS